MSDPTFNTVVLQACLDRMRKGDRGAENDLIKAVHSRLHALVGRMLRRFPNVRCVAETDDVFQNSAWRLLCTLRHYGPRTPRDFFNLAAVHIQRELIDLARGARRHKTVPLNLGGSTDLPGPREPAAHEEEDMDEWVELHLAIDQLPAQLREVVGLVLYHGWKQDRIAELLQVSARTVRRRWIAACQRIRNLARVASVTE